MKTQAVPLVAVVVAVLLQVLVAPIIPIGSVYPSFLVPLALVFAIVRGGVGVYAYAFVLGLLADLLSHTPVGLSSALLLLESLALSKAFEYLDKGTASMPLLALVAALFVYQAICAFVMAVMGQGGFVDLFVQRALIGTVYDAAIGICVYLVVKRLPMAETANDAWTVTNTRPFQ